MRFLTASRFFDGRHLTQAGNVLVLSDTGIIQEMLSADQIDPLKVEKFDGVITPGFINAHCHLELSHLHEAIPQRTGLVDFALGVIRNRSKIPAGEQVEIMRDADRYMESRGIVVVGDISNNNASFETKANSKLHYHTFIELIGLHPQRAEAAMNTGIQLFEELKRFDLEGSLAPHAPYSTSIKLMDDISRFNAQNGSIQSIHNQESDEEEKFLVSGTGDFTKLYQNLQIDISWFKPYGVRSLEACTEALLLVPTLLVHNTCTTLDEVTKTPPAFHWCFCPSANLYIEGKLPSFENFRNSANKVIGTDSLASNQDLDVVKEANLLMQHGNFSAEEVLTMITSAGATALGCDKKFGTLAAGTRPGLNLVTVNPKNIQFIKKIC